MPRPLLTVVETEIYLARATRLLDEGERNALVDVLAASPEIGDLVPGTGGLRKLRIPLSGRGKRGGARVIYFHGDRRSPVYLLLVFAKNEQADMNEEQRNTLRRVVDRIKLGYRR